MIEYKRSEDNWYKYKGVKPPERTPHGLTEEEIDEKLAKFKSDHTCQWKQKGPEIYCSVGAYVHGWNIGTSKRLIESKNGAPILQDI